MKNFVKENWYRLMIGSSIMMSSFGFLLYAISPVYSNPKMEKTINKSIEINKTSQGTNAVVHDEIAYFVDGGYLYYIELKNLYHYTADQYTWSKNYMKKMKLP